MNLPPLVSCIMPTANREKFVPFAIKYFLAQDYKNSELIILDDGSNPVSPLIPQNPRIRYYHLKQGRLNIGTKRNMACEVAKGDIIIHWDDDDWYAPNWISYQVVVLMSSGAEICGLSQLYFHNPGIVKTWKYVYPSNERPWVGGATMAYLKSLWKRNPFLNIQVGEDNQFVWFSKAKVVSHQFVNGFVSILHPGNTSPKLIDNCRWELQESANIDGQVKLILETYNNSSALFQI